MQRNMHLEKKYSSDKNVAGSKTLPNMHLNRLDGPRKLTTFSVH